MSLQNHSEHSVCFIYNCSVHISWDVPTFLSVRVTTRISILLRDPYGSLLQSVLGVRPKAHHSMFTVSQRKARQWIKRAHQLNQLPFFTLSLNASASFRPLICTTLWKNVGITIFQSGRIGASQCGIISRKVHPVAPICNPKGLGNQPLQTLGLTGMIWVKTHHNPVTE